MSSGYRRVPGAASFWHHSAAAVDDAKKSDKKSEKQAAAHVRAYLAALPPAVRKRMEQIRAAIRATAPGAVDHFSYQMPGFWLDGRTLIWYGAFRQHTSLFPITPALLRAHRLDVSGYETSKGTIRFPLSAPLPLALVKRLVKARVAEVRKRARS
jgi:uncharacterized protein YdhG (YjbR/CyaY superfamily)